MLERKGNIGTVGDWMISQNNKRKSSVGVVVGNGGSTVGNGAKVGGGVGNLGAEVGNFGAEVGGSVFVSFQS